MSAEKGKLDTLYLVKWAVIVLLGIIVACIPFTAIFTLQIKIFCVITVVCIFMFALGVFDSPLVPSLILIFAYSYMTDLTTATSGFGKDAPWICISVLLMVGVMEKTNILKRMTYNVVLLCGGSYIGICLGFYILGFVLCFLGNNMCLGLCALAYGMIKSLDLGDSRASAGIMFAAFNGITEGAILIMDPTAPGFLFGMAATAIENTSTTFTYFDYFKNNLAWIPFFVIFFIIGVLMFKPKKGEDSKLTQGKAFFRAEKAKLGQFTKDEIKLTVIAVLLLVYLLTTGLTGLGMVYGFIGAVILMFLPGIRMGTREDIKKVNFAFPIFMVACIAIGTVATSVGLGDMLTALMTPVLNGMSKVGFLAMVYVIVFILNIFMTPMAIYASMIAPMCMMGSSILGFTNAWPIVMTIMLGAMNIVLPHENNSALYMYSLGVTKMKDFVKLFTVKTILTFGWLFVMIAYWSAIGLM
ncbi:SLC13 family permease [Intestinimonas massiliensis (ex Afouda et al. 2020)]|uniref:SLC13 family permease n=1 Tax=Intestinimonas massiliensis (ex Afouda et al. 2020) TaxID=1673721 RepID=UPI001031C175|nr:SLC13 family permease [Intestinimonas massiliensis (ex Afouda et al. 2020)]